MDVLGGSEDDDVDCLFFIYARFLTDNQEGTALRMFIYILLVFSQLCACRGCEHHVREQSVVRCPQSSNGTECKPAFPPGDHPPEPLVTIETLINQQAIFKTHFTNTKHRVTICNICLPSFVLCGLAMLREVFLVAEQPQGLPCSPHTHGHVCLPNSETSSCAHATGLVYRTTLYLFKVLTHSCTRLKPHFSLPTLTPLFQFPSSLLLLEGHSTSGELAENIRQ